MKWMRILQVGIFWVGIFRGEFRRGKFDGLEFSEWKFSMRNFPRTLKHVGILKNIVQEIFLSFRTTMKIMPFCLYCVIHAICFFPYIKKMVLLIFTIKCSIFTICYKKPRPNHFLTFSSE